MATSLKLMWNSYSVHNCKRLENARKGYNLSYLCPYVDGPLLLLDGLTAATRRNSMLIIPEPSLLNSWKPRYSSSSSKYLRRHSGSAPYFAWLSLKACKRLHVNGPITFTLQQPTGLPYEGSNGIRASPILRLLPCTRTIWPQDRSLQASLIRGIRRVITSNEREANSAQHHLIAGSSWDLAS